jgi:hypothetical protein
MKKYIILFVLLFISTAAYAGTTVTFAWNPNTEQDLAGYKIYRSAESGKYDMEKPVLVVPCTALDDKCSTGQDKDVPDGTWFWSATAFDNKGNESGLSNEVTAALDSQAPNAPGSLHITLELNVNVK